jgi:aryl-alcohol dehydrogenase-like predicted oxidoreductase
MVKTYPNVTIDMKTKSLSQGKNERLIGDLLQDPSFRSKVFICTKFGIYPTGTGIAISGKPEYVRECVEESLRNLKVDSIDL